MSPEFLITTLVVVATPGTGVLFTLAAAVSRGARASVVAAIGCTLGIVPHMLAAITGLAAVLHASAVAFEIVRYAGVAYLLYIAWATWRDTGVLAVDEQTQGRSAGRVIASGILVNLLNPKLTIFFVAFLPQFVSTTGTAATMEMLQLSGAFMFVTLVVFIAYGSVAAALRTRVLSRPAAITTIRRTFAVAFVALAGRLALTER